jgi:CRP-like cAMP-binding protein
MFDLHPELKAYLAPYKLPDNALSDFTAALQWHQWKPRSYLLETGQTAHYMYFLASGLARFFFLNQQGQEVTSDFYFAPGFITSVTSFVNQAPSRFTIQTLLPVEALAISRNDLLDLYDKHPQLERMGRILTEQAYSEAEKHLLSLLNDAPKERYLRLLKEYPQYIQHIPLQYLASYLGITPESLSRIRKRIG